MDIFKNSFRKRQEKIYKENGYIQVNDLFPKYKLRNLRVSLIKTLNNSINKNLLINKTDSDEVLVNQIEITPYDIDLLSKFIIGVFQRNPEIYQFAVDKEILKICKLLNIEDPYMISDPLVMLHTNSKNISNLFSKPAPWHQDWQSMQGSKNSIVIWVPLVNIIPSITGSINILKKSHNNGLLNATSDNWFTNLNETIKNTLFDEFIPKLDLGNAIIFPVCVHKSFMPSINVDRNLRLVMQFRYSDRNCSLLKSNYYHYNYGHCLPLSKEPPKNIP